MIKKEIEVLGTVFTISLPNKYSFLFSKLFDELQRIEQKYTRFDSSSYLMNLNSHLFKKQNIDSETYFLLKFAEDMKKFTDGYFSIDQKNRLEVYGYGLTVNSSKSNIFSNFFSRNYFLFSSSIVLFKQIEIGGFGKGYALLKLKEFLDSQYVKEYELNAGGDIYVKGKSKIYLESPYYQENVFAYVFLKNTSLCSSSPSRRNFNSKHHLINPKLKDSNSDLIQVFIQEENPMKCDALSTALFVMGFEKAVSFSKKHNLLVLLITTNDMYSSINITYIN
ncbi:MAG: FAD:protein FMN transferase [Nanoarchaeota archaeon]|nr:FAD:protein FMN transferase [Nanoarchaeota archaeon]